MAQRMLDDEALLAIAKKSGGGSGGTDNYNELNNKPKINNVTLSGNKSSSDLGLQSDIGLLLTETAVVSDRDIIDGQGNTLSVLAEALTKTASGNPVVITDCAGGKARSLKTTIEPIQDLHGLPFPYVGGAYKNILPMTVEGIKAANTGGTWNGNVYTLNNVTFELLTDSASNITGIKVNGTNSSGTDIVFNVSGQFTFTSNANYIISGITTGAGNTYDIYGVYKISGSTAYTSVTTGDVNIAVNANDICYGEFIRLRNGQSISNITFYPMLRLSTESDATFAPYSNICPISGRTEARVDDTGKNQLPLTVASIKAANTEGTWDGNIYTAYGCTYEIITDNELVTGILVKGTSTINMSFWLGAFNYKANDTLKINSGINTGNDNIFFRISGSGKYVYTIQATSKGSDTTYTGNADVEFWGNIRIGSNIALPSSGLLFKPSLVFGTDSTAFEPYAHSSATIQLGTTVYGADINWDTGVATVTHQRINAKTLTWTLTAYNTMYTSDLSELAVKSERATVLCNILPYKNITNGNGEDNVVFWGGTITESNGNLCIKCTSIATNVGAWTYYINHNDVYICYKLAEPITIQLTPTQLQMLKGYNRVSIDNGSIELGYIAKIA